MPLYPTIAVSDAFLATCHFLGAALLFPRSSLAAVGFTLVALAGTFGVLRFGVSEKKFSPINDALADTAAMVGLPFVGLFAQSMLARPALPVDGDGVVAIGALLFLQGVSRGLSPALLEIVKIVLNLVCFIVPLGAVAMTRGDYTLAAAVVAFIVGGVLVGDDRHKCLFGVRCENLFHYILGVSTYLIACQISK